MPSKIVSTLLEILLYVSWRYRCVVASRAFQPFLRFYMNNSTSSNMSMPGLSFNPSWDSIILANPARGQEAQPRFNPSWDSTAVGAPIVLPPGIPRRFNPSWDSTSVEKNCRKRIQHKTGVSTLLEILHEKNLWTVGHYVDGLVSTLLEILLFWRARTMSQATMTVVSTLLEILRVWAVSRRPICTDSFNPSWDSTVNTLSD